MALGIVQIALGLFGLALAAAKFGAFPPLERFTRSSPRGPVVYAVLAFFSTFLVFSGIRELA